MEPESGLDCVHFVCVPNRSPLAPEVRPEPWLSRPLHLSSSFGLSLWYVHRRERHTCYMGSFVDFYVGIPQSAWEMKLIFFCSAPVTHLVLLLCIRLYWEPLDPYGVAGRNGDHRLC